MKILLNYPLNIHTRNKIHTSCESKHPDSMIKMLYHAFPSGACQQGSTVPGCLRVLSHGHRCTWSCASCTPFLLLRVPRTDVVRFEGHIPCRRSGNEGIPPAQKELQDAWGLHVQSSWTVSALWELTQGDSRNVLGVLMVYQAAKAQGEQGIIVGSQKISSFYC